MLSSIYHAGLPLTLGILGGGQLAKMTAQAAYRMGLRVAIIEHAENSPAGMMTKLDFPKGWSDDPSLDEFIKVSDIVTLENEFIDGETLQIIAEKRQVYPMPQTMLLVQDKLTQKETFLKAGIPMAEFAPIHTVEDGIAFGEKWGFPFVIKTRKYGYDGYGNATVYDKYDIQGAINKFHDPESPRELMAESFVKFSKELAVMVARNRRGETVVYPCVETVQRNHICHAVLAPAPVSDEVLKAAQDIALKCVETIKGVGVFGIEMFLKEDGSLAFNEIAPRPHNSGHYTIEACHTSQFENHVRAVCNLPLGSPAMVVPAACMINILGVRTGQGIPDTPVGTLKEPHAALHLYGKKDSRTGRKMGHITALGSTLEEAYTRANTAAEELVW
ncbi:MAG TPA: 5-(carboxyamino)imidazole ribonucleotide synthase [Patescibacteria group bacterium]|nr:5-(carboxyamino)imidazole ribonucleotide synthase [Patescibacteria group bacterium]